MRSPHPVAGLLFQSGKTPLSNQSDRFVPSQRASLEDFRKKEIEGKSLLFKPKLNLRGHNTSITFRLKGARHSGVSVNEAIERARLSKDTAYLVSPDMSSKISVRVRVRFVSSPSFLEPSD